MIKPILMMSALLLMTACLGITAGPGPQYHSWYCEIWKGLDKDARAAWIRRVPHRKAVSAGTFGAPGAGTGRTAPVCAWRPCVPSALWSS